MRGEHGFSLAETLVALFVAVVMSVIALPDFRAIFDRTQLDLTADRLVSDLATAQATAMDAGGFCGVRFAPFGDTYQVCSPGRWFGPTVAFAAPTRYFEGYLHLQEPYLRYYSTGTVSESGQVGLVDPEGDVRDVIVSLGFGVLREYRHMVLG